MFSGVVLLAAGSGKRMGSKKPKQFLRLDGVPLFVKSLRVFLKIPTVREIVVVCTSENNHFVQRWIKRFRSSATIKTAEGGRYRGESVRNGVKALSDQVDVVLVHDSARPMVTPAIVRRVEKAAHTSGAAVAAWPLPDTLKLAKKDATVKKTIPRSGLWVAQTPQGFRRDVALKCLLKPSSTATDDVELAERRGIRVKLVEGAATNFKVTVPTDLKVCRILCR